MTSFVVKIIYPIVIITIIGVVSAASPTASEDSQFMKFIRNVQKGDGFNLQERMTLNPKAKAWENSGKYQGDILLDEYQLARLVQARNEEKNAYIWPNTKWPEKTIPYVFGAGQFTSSEQSYILAAMKEIEQETCIKFRPRHWFERNYVMITPINDPLLCRAYSEFMEEHEPTVPRWQDGLAQGLLTRPDGCYANVGYWSTRGIHTLNLARNGCILRTIVIHEWLHIIGFLHMQSTYNRDDYVRVMWQNIMPGMAFNFDKYSIDVVSNLGLPYEYDSNLHYGPYGFSVNGQPTLLPTKAHSGTMGQLDYVTKNDWKRVNRLYNCVGAWS